MNKDYDWNPAIDDIRSKKIKPSKYILPTEEEHHNFIKNLEKAQISLEEMRIKKNKSWWKFW